MNHIVRLVALTLALFAIPSFAEFEEGGQEAPGMGTPELSTKGIYSGLALLVGTSLILIDWKRRSKK